MSEDVIAPDAALRALVPLLTHLGGDVTDATRIDRIRLLEEVKSAAAAAQARETAAFAASQRAAQRAAGVPAERAGRGIAAQVGLAMRQSHFRAARYVGWATILTAELPATFQALQAGRTTEWRAMIVARETAWLSREHRAAVDTALAPRLEHLGDRRIEAEAAKHAARLDPAGAVARTRLAANDRRVGIRPAPDTMSRLSITTPVAQGVAAYAALRKHAESAVSHGDPRTRDQIMADTAVERLTGQAHATDVPVEVHLVMTDQALLGTTMPTESESDPRRPAGRDEPAYLHGFGPIPAGAARDLVFGVRNGTPQWIRRLFVRPGTGELIAMDSRRRCFTDAQRHFLELADQVCRTPWCGAPIRHIDHVTPAAAGGPTSVGNGQGTCAACNHAKQAPGWHTVAIGAGSREAVDTVTPTGHRYRSHPPDPPGTATAHQSPVEAAPARRLEVA